MLKTSSLRVHQFLNLSEKKHKKSRFFSFDFLKSKELTEEIYPKILTEEFSVHSKNFFSKTTLFLRRHSYYYTAD